MIGMDLGMGIGSGSGQGGKDQAEEGPVSGFRLQLDAAAIGFREGFDDGQTEAVPFGASGQHIFDAVEFVEHEAVGVAGDARSFVLDIQLDGFSGMSGGDAQVTRVAAVFEGVLHQVSDDGVQAIGIRHDGGQVLGQV